MSEYFAANDPALAEFWTRLLSLDAGRERAERTGGELEALRIATLIDTELRSRNLTPLDLEQARSKARHES